jgi:hypothetical protein
VIKSIRVSYTRILSLNVAVFRLHANQRWLPKNQREG